MNLLYELPLLKGNSIQPGLRFDYRSNFAFATQPQDSGWYVNLLFTVTLVLLVPALLLLFSPSNIRQALACRRFAPAAFNPQRPTEVYRTLMAVMLVAIFTFVMVTPLSTPLWALLPNLASMEFPWRWLSTSSILASGLAGFSLPVLW